MKLSLRHQALFLLIGVLSNILSAQYLNESIMLYLDVTVYTYGEEGNISDSSLLDDMINCFEATGSTVVYDIYDMDLSQTHYLSEYIYWDDNTDLECSFRAHLYFESEDDFNRAVTEYETAVSTNLNTFVAEYEVNIDSELSSVLDIETVSINSMKIDQRDEDDDSGRSLIDYHFQMITTSTSSTSDTEGTEPGTSTPSTSNDNGNGDNNNGNGTGFNQLIKEEWAYWLILIAFLCVGCCCGGFCWWYCCKRLRDWLDEDSDLLDRFDSAKYSYSARLSFSNRQTHGNDTKDDASGGGKGTTDHGTNGHNGMPPGNPMVKNAWSVTSVHSTPDTETKKGRDSGGKPKAKTRPKRAQTDNTNLRRIAMQDEGSNTVEGNVNGFNDSFNTIREDEEMEALKRKKQREQYIEYGSDYDSEEERERMERKKKKKKKRHHQKSPNSKDKRSPKSTKSNQSNSRSPERNKLNAKEPKMVKFKSNPVNGYPAASSSLSSDGGRNGALGRYPQYSSDSESSLDLPRRKTKNKRTGVVEPDRYDVDGKRIPTTKELLAKYKKEKARPSVELTYKVGKSGDDHKIDNDNAASGTESDSSDRNVRRRGYKKGRSETMDATRSRSKERRIKRPSKFLRNSSRDSRGRRPRSARYSDVGKQSHRRKDRRSYRDTDSDESE